jgi:ATP-dependent Clp protease ATP-binding subunit ClpB
MRLDKLTTRFQQALSDAQSLAVGNDQQFIEPQHLLLALLEPGGRLDRLAVATRRRQCRRR